jgi:hypothetical protein
MPIRQLTAALALCMVLGIPTAALAGSLSELLPNLFGQGGILLRPSDNPPFTHEPHFLVSSEQQLTVLNDSLRGQLSNVPLPSPVGGFTFRFDPTLGAFTRTTESFGPIYSQRADTTGRGRITIGGSYSRFTFDSLDGKNLNNGELGVTFLHEPTCTLAGRPNCPFNFERDTITGRIKAGITSDVFLASATYGVTDNLDVSIAVPIIHTEIRLTGIAHINRIGTAGEIGTPTHQFSNGSDTLTVHAADESTGIGDIVLRAKYNFFRSDPVLLAAGLDLRLPSGSEDDLRGVGTPVVSPVFIASTRPFFGVSPHLNVGFHLSGNTGKLDHEFFYNVGFDWSVVKPVTFVFDVLGRRIIDNHRLKAGQGPNGTEIADSNIVDAALGVKVNVWKNLLGVANVLLPLNRTGLRDNAAWLVGFETSF